MAQTTTTIIKTTFQLRRGLAASWTKNNPVLAVGEPGFERDTYRLKIGDGETAWNDLAYFGGTATIEVDGESIEIVGGKIALKGFAAAQPGFLAAKGLDGSLTWTNKIDISYIDIPEDTELIIEDRKICYSC